MKRYATPCSMSYFKSPCTTTRPDGWSRTSHKFQTVFNQVFCKEIDVSTWYHQNHIPLECAIKTPDRSITMLHLLLKHGADVNQPGYRGQRPIFWAARLGHAEWVEELLKWGHIQTKVSILLETYGWDREDLEDKKSVDIAN
ncbi:hypothetical protein P280DRAFT_11812 [Massarina eburnea CBS 473.64]|uniref:Uncharacterized protein n=1 Tax=Massarina eburnea CBS 473.64 TaxID=1395130 RepID=A0A6A6SJ80_9PLEO|nr:hypothetical protein P280DRAFT_11812 [Massarina eburnea CBS 473.64]